MVLMLLVKLPNTPAVVCGHSGMFADVLADGKLPAIASEILGNVSSILKAVHDIGKLRCVRQPERMPGFMKAGQIHDGFTEQRVARLFGWRQHVDLGAAEPVDHDRPRFPV